MDLDPRVHGDLPPPLSEKILPPTPTRTPPLPPFSFGFEAVGFGSNRWGCWGRYAFVSNVEPTDTSRTDGMDVAMERRGSVAKDPRGRSRIVGKAWKEVPRGKVRGWDETATSTDRVARRHAHRRRKASIVDLSVRNESRLVPSNASFDASGDPKRRGNPSTCLDQGKTTSHPSICDTRRPSSPTPSAVAARPCSPRRTSDRHAWPALA